MPPAVGGEESYQKPINIFVDMVHDILSQFTDDDSLLCDAMVIALNHLPARHFCRLGNIGRMPAGEREDLRFLAEEAARKAINYVRAHPKR
ncbi:late competence development ComFB family protein [Acidithiobacillus sp. VAN18-4]|nr:late competence development ComFB family protein [Acidithiobacillus sp. CV18-3]MBU2758184.1 late competence development ComFB family protein [Acidithiobacillus sp. BN09-2]MBU2798964.1 late competence development ComFB family protein [Acidithiobacillus sp. VAN18-4]